MAGVGVVRGHVHLVRADGHRRAEVDLLPSRGRLIREDGGGQQHAVAAPEVADVRARVAAALVEPQPGDVAGDIGVELDADLDGGRIVPRCRAGRHRAIPEAAQDHAILEAFDLEAALTRARDLIRLKRGATSLPRPCRIIVVPPRSWGLEQNLDRATPRKESACRNPSEHGP